jgi:hypothetical protein
MPQHHIAALHAAYIRKVEIMNRKASRFVLSSLVGLVFAVTTSLAQAAPGVLPPYANAFGKGYDELAADWIVWVSAIPASSNPLFDDDGSYGAIGQGGKVWFLVGTTGGSASRSITVPTGVAVFFPIVNQFWINTPEYGDPPWSDQAEADARALLAEIVNTAENLVLEIDGKTYPNVYTLRAESPVVMCNLPPVDNIFGVILAPVPRECLADGYWALLPPLSVGEHTVRFAGGFSYGDGFSLDVTYLVTVKAGRKAGGGM